MEGINNRLLQVEQTMDEIEIREQENKAEELREKRTLKVTGC